MPTKINTPDIRFKGFSAPWEQRELNDIVLNHNAGVYIAKEQYGIGLNIIGVGDLYSSDVVDGTIYRYAPVSDIKYLLETGDIIYGESSLVPEGIAKAMYVNEKGSNTAFAWHTRRVKVNKKIVDSFFVVLEINYNSMTRTFLMQNSTQTALTGMTTSSFLKAPIQVCSKEEQLRISSMFSKVDNLITLHQRKCDSLKEIKKTLLEKMFPANGNSVPDIRFKGFTDAWEQRKVGDWGVFCYGHSAPKWSVTVDAKTPCVRYGELYTKFGSKIDKVYSHTNIPDEKLIFSDGSEVLIPRVGEDPYDYNHCAWLSLANVAIGEMISIYKTGQNPLFTAIMFNSTLRNEFAKRVEGGSVTNLYYDKLKNIEVRFPIKLEEQNLISSFADKIDNLITLHQRKCDMLKEMKKTMLKKMFV